MKQITFRKYYYLCLAIVLVLSIYPLYMGFKVLIDYVRFGHVMVDNYPKYLIPYTPISLSLIMGTALLPLSLKLRKWGQLLFPCFALPYSFSLS